MPDNFLNFLHSIHHMLESTLDKPLAVCLSKQQIQLIIAARDHLLELNRQWVAEAETIQYTIQQIDW